MSQNHVHNINLAQNVQAVDIQYSKTANDPSISFQDQLVETMRASEQKVEPVRNNLSQISTKPKVEVAIKRPAAKAEVEVERKTEIEAEPKTAVQNELQPQDTQLIAKEDTVQNPEVLVIKNLDGSDITQKVNYNIENFLALQDVETNLVNDITNANAEQVAEFSVVDDFIPAVKTTLATAVQDFKALVKKYEPANDVAVNTNFEMAPADKQFLVATNKTQEQLLSKDQVQNNFPQENESVQEVSLSNKDVLDILKDPNIIDDKLALEVNEVVEAEDLASLSASAQAIAYKEKPIEQVTNLQHDAVLEEEVAVNANFNNKDTIESDNAVEEVDLPVKNNGLRASAETKQQLPSELSKAIDNFSKLIASSDESILEGEVGATTIATIEEVEGDKVSPSFLSKMQAEASSTSQSLNKQIAFKQEDFVSNVIEQIDYKINTFKNSDNQVNRIAIQLVPENLGRLDVVFKHESEGVMKVEINCESFQTMVMLKNSEEKINAILADNGFNTESTKLDFNFNNNPQGFGNKEQAEQELFAFNEFDNLPNAQNVAKSYSGKLFVNNGGIDLRV